MEPPPHPALAYLHPTRLWDAGWGLKQTADDALWYHIRGILSVLFKSCTLWCIWYYLGQFTPNKWKNRKQSCLVVAHMSAGPPPWFWCTEWPCDCGQHVPDLLWAPWRFQAWLIHGPPIFSWDEWLWLRRPCDLRCFSPSHSQVTGKKEGRHPPCLAAMCKAPELHRRGWELLCDSSSSCATSLTAEVKLWVTGCEKPQTWDIKVSFGCWSKLGAAAQELQSAWATFKEHLLTAGNNNKSHIITFLEDTNTFSFPFLFFFSIFFRVFKLLCLD